MVKNIAVIPEVKDEFDEVKRRIQAQVGNLQIINHSYVVHELVKLWMVCQAVQDAQPEPIALPVQS